MVFLLSNGTSITDTNANDETSILVAAKYGRARAVALLLAHGVNVHDRNTIFSTPINQ